MNVASESEDAIKGDRLFKRWLLFVVGVVWLFALGAVAAYIWRFGADGLSGDQGVWGQLGDFLGGVINPMIGIATVGLLAWSMAIQREELRASVAEQKLLVAQQTEQTRIAAIQLQEQRERFEREAKDRTRAAQPVLDLSCRWLSSDDRWVRGRVDVRGFGNPCSGFTIEAAGRGDIFDCESLLHVTSEPASIGFILAKGIHEIDVEIVYTDVLGEPQFLPFTITHSGDGTFQGLTLTAAS